MKIEIISYESAVRILGDTIILFPTKAEVIKTEFEMSAFKLVVCKLLNIKPLVKCRYTLRIYTGVDSIAKAKTDIIQIADRSRYRIVRIEKDAIVCRGFDYVPFYPIVGTTIFLTRTYMPK